MTSLLEQSMSLINFSLLFIAAAALLVFILGYVTMGIYMERKVLGWMQLRRGPTEAGPFGLLQAPADVLKLLLKEDTIPRDADKDLFVLAPIITFIPSFVVLVTIPYSPNLFFADLNIGVLFYIAMSGISTLGMILGGWSSNNKLALLGGMRSAAQMISYEIPLVLSVVGVVLLSGSMNLNTIIEGQGNWFWEWNFLPQIIGFIVFMVAGVAELNRTPFDLPEAESELVAGYHVEYSGFRFAFFMLAEYIFMFGIAGLTVALFLGGWHAPFPFLDFIPGWIWYLIKLFSIIFFLFWIRGTFPRIRVDQLMGMGWKWLLPLALINIFITAILMQVFK